MNPEEPALLAASRAEYLTPLEQFGPIPACLRALTVTATAVELGLTGDRWERHLAEIRAINRENQLRYG